jgi:NAD(P)H-dependent FMN reductase
VIDDLTDLGGPAFGTVELPLRLFWSLPGHRFDLDDHDMRQWYCQTVLREASRAEDLTMYLNAAMLASLWPDLYLATGVRRAWEEQHHSLPPFGASPTGGARMGAQERPEQRNRMRVLLVSGSTRSGSANTAALVTAAALAPPGVTTALYQGLAGLPAFNPDHDGELLPEPVAELRREIAAADAVLFCTPEYAGTLPGSLKNLLDWTVGGGELYGKPVAWLNVAAANRGQGAQQTLASVLGYVGAVIVEPACRHVPVDRSATGPDGTISDPGFAAVLAEAWTELVRQAGQGISG